MCNHSLARILPFALYMGFIAIEQGLRWLCEQDFLSMATSSLLFLYPVKVGIVGLSLLLLARHYDEIRLADLRHWRHSLLSLLTGLVIFAFWIQLDQGFATLGDPAGFNPLQVPQDAGRNLLILARLAGAVLVVPLMEELFWRSFLPRYLIDPHFKQVAIGRFSLYSFVTTSLLFGLEHHHYLAGILAGVLFNLLLYRSRSIAQCILSHAVANLALGLYVLRSGQWHFW